jgi:hypothetical protein
MRNRTPRGVALITVMLLLTTVAWLVLALLIRSNSNLFTAGREVASTQAFYVADAAGREKAMMLIEDYWLTGSASAAVAAMRAGVNRDFAVYEASGAVCGWADVSYSIDAPHLADRGGAFGTSPYVTVTISVSGSAESSAHPWRALRAVDLSYNLAGPGLPADILDFAYFMNHWVWFTDFGMGQAQLVGNSAANGNYDVMHSDPSGSAYLTLVSGPGYTYGPTGLSYNDNPYTQLYLRSQNTGYDPSVYGSVLGASGTQSPPRFGRIPVPRDLARIADESGPYIQTARAAHGTLQVKTVRLTGVSPLSYTLQSTQTLTASGVYGDDAGQKESLVLPGTVSAAAKKGDVVKIVSIQGPVVVKGNVVIEGFVEGQGTLYAGRNLYVAGNLVYVDPPSCSPASGETHPSQVPQPTAADASRDKILYCAAGSVVYGDVTDRAQWDVIMQWFGYVDPESGERINDNHEDAGLDGIVDSRAFNPADTRESDGLWTVEIRNPASGEIKLADLPVVSGTAEVPSGWAVVAGSGEDADGNGRYTPPYEYGRDFLFASRVDGNGTWSAIPFNSSGFDNYPGGSYASFCKPITRVDGFVMANDAVGGWLGDNAHNLVFYGGEAGRQECMATQLNGHDEIIYQDVRFSQVNDIGAPNAVRVAFAAWSER